MPASEALTPFSPTCSRPQGLAAPPENHGNNPGTGYALPLEQVRGVLS